MICTWRLQVRNVAVLVVSGLGQLATTGHGQPESPSYPPETALHQDVEPGFTD